MAEPDTSLLDAAQQVQPVMGPQTPQAAVPQVPIPSVPEPTAAPQPTADPRSQLQAFTAAQSAEQQQRRADAQRRIAEIDQELATGNPGDDPATKQLRDESLRAERQQLLGAEAQAQASTQPAPASQPTATAEGAPQGTGAAPRMIDPSGADTDLARARQTVEQLAQLEAQNPDAVVAGTPGRSAMVNAGGATQAQRDVQTQGEQQAVQQLEQAQRQQAELDEQQVQREVSAARTVAETEAEKARIAQQAAEEEASRQQEIARDVDQRRSEIDQGLDDFLSSADELDPNRVWNQASTGEKVGGAIAIMLSALGQGLAGGENMALKLMNRASERDLRTQQLKLQAKERGIRTSFSALEAAVNAGATESEAAAAVRDRMFQAQIQRATAAEAAAKVPETKEAIGRVRLGLQELQAQNRLSLEQSLRVRVSQTQQTKRVTTGGSRLTAGQAAERARAQLGTPKFDSAKFVPQLGVQFADATEAKEARNQLAKVQEMQSISNELRRLKKDEQWAADPRKRARAEALGEQLVLANAQTNDLGALSESDLRLAEAMATGGKNPLDVTSTVMQRLESLDSIVQHRTNSLKEIGVPPDRVPPIFRQQQRLREKRSGLRGQMRQLQSDRER